MKQILLSILVLISGYGFAVAQNSLSIEPAMAFGNGPVSSTDIGAHALVTNTSPDTVSLLWSRQIISSQQGWTSWICDLNNCYLPYVDVCPTSRPNVLAPGESVDFQIHINPAGIEGNGEIHVNLYDASDPGTSLGLVQAMFETSTSAVADLSANALKLYPNPTTSHFQVSNPINVNFVVIHSLVGNKVREYDARIAGARYDVSDLPQGIYLVRLLDASHNVLKTVRLSKR